MNSNSAHFLLAAACTLGAILSPVTASADSDGYFCAGEGYLAYEMAFSVPTDGHRLNILTPGVEQIAAARDIPLPDFQVQGMVCSKDTVILKDFAGIYKVDLGDGTINRSKAKAHPLPMAEPGNLVNGHWADPATETTVQIITLPGWPKDALYELHIISYETHPHPGTILHHTISQLVRTFENSFVDTQLIYSGSQQETID